MSVELNFEVYWFSNYFESFSFTKTLPWIVFDMKFISPCRNQSLKWISGIQNFHFWNFLCKAIVRIIVRMQPWDLRSSMLSGQTRQGILPIGRSAFRRKTYRQVQIWFVENIRVALPATLDEASLVLLFWKARGIALKWGIVIFRES